MEIVEVPYLLENKIKKHICFEDEGISVHELSGLGSDVFIPAHEIAAYRYGAPATMGYKFSIGRQYFIHIKKYNGEVYKFRFTSLYGIRRKQYHAVWNSLYQLLHKYYLDSLHSYYFELLNLRQPFEIGGISFIKEGVQLNRKTFIDWKHVAISNYVTYFMVYDKRDYRYQRCFNFATDWNAAVLQHLLRSIAAYYERHKDPPVNP